MTFCSGKDVYESNETYNKRKGILTKINSEKLGELSLEIISDLSLPPKVQESYLPIVKSILSWQQNKKHKDKATNHYDKTPLVVGISAPVGIFCSMYYFFS